MSVIQEINIIIKDAQARQMYQTGISVPLSLYGGKGRTLWGGGRLDVGPDGKQKASVGGVSVRKWEDLPSTKIMLDASNPKVNTPAVRRQKMMAYMPNAFRSRTSKPVSQQTGVASSPGQKFDFRGEAVKLLKSYGANASRAKGGYSTDIGRNMISQWKDMQANPQKYDEASQRQILDQWRSNIAQMRAGSSQHANPQSIASAHKKQQPVAQAAQNNLRVTTARRKTYGTPVAQSSNSRQNMTLKGGRPGIRLTSATKSQSSRDQRLQKLKSFGGSPRPGIRLTSATKSPYSREQRLQMLKSFGGTPRTLF